MLACSGAYSLYGSLRKSMRLQEHGHLGRCDMEMWKYERMATWTFVNIGMLEYGDLNKALRNMGIWVEVKITKSHQTN